MNSKFKQFITIIAFFLSTVLFQNKTMAQSEFGVVGGKILQVLIKIIPGLLFDFETRTGGILGV